MKKTINGVELDICPGARLNRAKLKHAQLNHASLNDAKLKHAQLNDASLKYAQLNGAELNRAELNRAQLNNAELNHAQLNDASLKGAQLKGAELNYADFSGANLDFSSGIPLWCGGLSIKCDKKLFFQYFYHICTWECTDDTDQEIANIKNLLRPLANKSHIVEKYELPILISDVEKEVK